MVNYPLSQVINFQQAGKNSHHPEGGASMKRTLVVIAALTTLAIPAICPAASARPGAYMSGFLGFSVSPDTNVASSDFITNDNFNDRVEFDPNINIGGTGGYDFGIVRLEGELSYKHAGIGAVT